MDIIIMAQVTKRKTPVAKRNNGTPLPEFWSRCPFGKGQI
jgi:hypothetical protein